MSERRAEIVGGGIAGLTMAYLLARRGWRARVHERAPEIREIGAGIFLKNNSVAILESLGIADRVLARGIQLLTAEIRDHRGKLIQQRALTGLSRVFNVPRADVVLGLAAAARAQGAEIVVGSTVERIDPAGGITLAGGERHRADLIVLAGGNRSALRDQLGLTARAFELGTGATRFLVPRTGFESVDGTREFWSGRRRIGIAPCTADLTYTYMSCPESDLSGRALPVDVASWQHSFPPIAGFFDGLRAAGGGTRFAYFHVVCSRWSKGRVAVIGDAAHALPPTLGQGAGLTVTNAAALAAMLDIERDIDAALSGWEARYRPITDQTQRWSLRYDALTARWPRELSAVRRAIIWGFGRFRWLNDRMRVADRVLLPGAAAK